MCDDGPNETVKKKVIVTLGSASLDETTESVMLGSTVGPASGEIKNFEDLHYEYIKIMDLL